MGKKKIMLQETAPKVGSSFGEKILRKYGWEDGKGLGKYTNGTIEPIVLQANSGCRGVTNSLFRWETMAVMMTSQGSGMTGGLQCTTIWPPRSPFGPATDHIYYLIN